MTAPDRFARLVAAAAAVASIAYVLAFHGRRDLWFDEVASVDQFVVIPLSKAATWYPYTNHHVLSNLLANAWLTLTGFKTFGSVAAEPFLLRWISIAASAGTLWYAWLLVRRIAGERAAALAVATLGASLCFTSFAAQIRGYAVSALCCTATLHHLASFADGGRRRHAAFAVVAGALSFYALPSNLYFLGALGGAHGLAWVAFRGRRDLLASLTAALALGSGLLLYAPMWDGLFGNPIVQSHGAFRWKTLYSVMPGVLLQFALDTAPALLLSAWIWIRTARGPGDAARDARRRALLFGATLLLPFVLSFVRADHPVERVFQNLVVVAAAAAGIGAAPFLSAGRLVAAVLVMGAWGVASHVAVQRSIAADIDRDAVRQDLRGAYFLAPSFDMHGVRSAVAVARQEGDVVLAHDLDRVAVAAYLRLSGIACLRPERAADALGGTSPVIVVTGQPGRFLREMSERHPHRVVERIELPRNRFAVFRASPR
ncbi:MAG: hypothetical protein HMLKMBBP_00514 [Planctomycetes bacterium]|nr:hypothetical protein [Planctomycetota bacterium]